MKTMKLLGILCAFVFSMGLTACSLDEEPENKVEMIEMYVSAETKSYPASEFFPAIEYLWVKEKKESEYTLLCFGEIRGFQYEKGYEYKLLVEKTILANPPADGSNVQYRLIEILSKNP